MDAEVYFSPPSSGLADALRALVVMANEPRLKAELDHVRFYLESVLPEESPTAETVTE
jgi:hypothetical protein